MQIAFSTTAVVLAQTFVALPFLVVSLEGSLRTAGSRYERVAATLGASPTTVLAAGDAAAGAARAGLRGGAVVRPGARRVRGDPDVRGQPAGRHPHPAARDLPAARDRCRCGRGVVAGARRGRGAHRGGFARAGRRGLQYDRPERRRRGWMRVASTWGSTSATGEVLAVLGPNGAGKSTLLSVVAGLVRPTSGASNWTVACSPTPHRGVAVPPHRRGIALLAQQALLFPHLTAAANVAFGPRSAGRATSGRRGRSPRNGWTQWMRRSSPTAVRRAVRGAGPAGRGRAGPRGRTPGLLLLDEPMAALDVAAAPALRSPAPTGAARTATGPPSWSPTTSSTRWRWPTG